MADAFRSPEYFMTKTLCDQLDRCLTCFQLNRERDPKGELGIRVEGWHRTMTVLSALSARDNWKLEMSFYELEEGLTKVSIDPFLGTFLVERHEPDQFAAAERMKEMRRAKRSP